jgi:phosphoribosyl 1,2-cyclic phosphate phosphodiesterase
MISSLLFLGTGASLGVPMIGCNCEVCTSKSPFNKRLRSSALIKWGEKRLLIDSGPDFRQQALLHNIKTLDGVLYTHAHQDHVAGIDDLRIYFFKNQAPLPCLGSKETADDIKNRFHFMFEGKSHEKNTPRLRFEELEGEEGYGEFLDIPFGYCTYVQLGMKVTGFRFGDIAYLTDLQEPEERLIPFLEGVDTLVLSALRHTPSHMHLTIDQAVDFARKAQVKKTFLTHVSHDLDYYKTNSVLPPEVRLAYDGLEILFKGI